jgi:hypothetical protein
MRKLITATVLAATGIALGGQATTRPAGPAPATSVATTDHLRLSKSSPLNHPVIVHIVAREKTLTISSGPNGPLYSLAQQDGKILVADASGDEFAKQQPELYRQMRQYVAVKNDTSGAWAGTDDAAIMDASVGRE